MRRLAPIILTVALCAQFAPQVSAQSSAPAGAEGTAGGVPVIDVANIAQQLVDMAIQKVRTRVMDDARRKAFSHFRRVSQHAGVDVFQGGIAREALTSRVPARRPGLYTRLYRPGYAAGIPEGRQDSLSAARMDSVTISHAREMELLQRDIEQLNKQIAELNRELARRLTRRAPRWGNNPPNPQGDIEQLQAALQAKTGMVTALHAIAAVLGGYHGFARDLYGRQQDARYGFKVERGAQEFVGHRLPPPFVPDPRYDGAKRFLRFPGLREGGGEN